MSQSESTSQNPIEGLFRVVRTDLDAEPVLNVVSSVSQLPNASSAEGNSTTLPIPPRARTLHADPSSTAAGSSLIPPPLGLTAYESLSSGSGQSASGSQLLQQQQQQTPLLQNYAPSLQFAQSQLSGSFSHDSDELQGRGTATTSSSSSRRSREGLSGSATGPPLPSISENPGINLRRRGGGASLPLSLPPPSPAQATSHNHHLPSNASSVTEETYHFNAGSLSSGVSPRRLSPRLSETDKARQRAAYSKVCQKYLDVAPFRATFDPMSLSDAHRRIEGLDVEQLREFAKLSFDLIIQSTADLPLSGTPSRPLTPRGGSTTSQLGLPVVLHSPPPGTSSQNSPVEQGLGDSRTSHGVVFELPPMVVASLNTQRSSDADMQQRSTGPSRSPTTSPRMGAMLSQSISGRPPLAGNSSTGNLVLPPTFNSDVGLRSPNRNDGGPVYPAGRGKRTSTVFAGSLLSPKSGGAIFTPKFNIDSNFRFGEPVNVSVHSLPAFPYMTGEEGSGNGSFSQPFASGAALRRTSTMAPSVFVFGAPPDPSMAESPSHSGSETPNGPPLPTPKAYGRLMARAQRRLSSIFVNPDSLRPAVHTTAVNVTETEDSYVKVNQYVFLETLGRGGQGLVYLGYDEVLGEFRAVKELRRPLQTSEAMKRILTEIDIMKTMRHKNIVSLHEVLDDPKTNKLYIVMQYIEHGPLVKWLPGTASRLYCQPIPAVRFAYYARQLCAGLTYLHRQKILHRDIKPDNILLGKDDTVYLTDFGVSQILVPQQTGTPQHSPLSLEEEEDEEARKGMRAPTDAIDGLIGTPAFFAPEMIRKDLAASAERQRSSQSQSRQNLEAKVDDDNSGEGRNDEDEGEGEGDVAAILRVNRERGAKFFAGLSHVSDSSSRERISISSESRGSFDKSATVMDDSVLPKGLDSTAKYETPETTDEGAAGPGGTDSTAAIPLVGGPPLPNPIPIPVAQPQPQPKPVAPPPTASAPVEGEKLDGEAMDIWALGISFFMFLCGYHPFVKEIQFDSNQNPIYPSPAVGGMEDRAGLDNSLEEDPHRPLALARKRTQSARRNSSDSESESDGSAEGHIEPGSGGAQLDQNQEGVDLCLGEEVSWEVLQQRILTEEPHFPSWLPEAWRTILEGMLQKSQDKRWKLPEVRSAVKDLNS